MAGITVSGIGSGLDIGGIVEQLVAAERAPEATRIQRAQSDTKLKLSAMTTLSSAFNSLQSALSSLKSDSTYGVRTAKSADEAIFKASAANGAQAGTYEVEVEALASAHKLMSGTLAATTGLGAGTLHVSVGSKTFDVTVTAGQDTPAGIRDAFNSAATAAGASITAGLINGDSGASLVFTAGTSGAANAITITRTGGSSGLDALVYDPGTLESLTQRTAAVDARVRVDGVLKTGTTNQLADAVPGVTLNLLATNAGSTAALTVAADNSTTSKTVNSFVAAYNNAIDAMTRVTAYGGATGTSGALIGDSMVRSASGQLRNAIGSEIGELAALGLDTGTNGKLTFNSAKLESALAADTAAVTDRLQSLGTSLATITDRYVGTDGIFGGRTTSLNARIRSLEDQTSHLDLRMEDVRTRYMRQFTALDTLIGQMNTTSSYLSQQLAALL